MCHSHWRSKAAACLVAALGAGSLGAAVIRGVVVENLTSKPLARAVVVLQPIAGTPGATKSARASSHGGFLFEALPAGAYIIKASHKNYMPAEYGQKRWNSAGTPVVLEDRDTQFLNIRLLRYSAINGTLEDENDEGLPGHDVVAYRVSSPPELMAHATSDERGIYRLHVLEPGAYVVRTAGNQSNDEAFMPTYAKETDKLDQAHVVELLPEQDADDVDVRPLPGRLFSISAGVSPANPDVSITLVSETGRKTVKAASYRFTHLPPGDYELFAQSPAGPAPGEKFLGAYQRISLGRDAGVSLLLRSPSGVTVSGAPADASMRLRIRRHDLAGSGPEAVLTVENGSATLPIGRWEALLESPAGYYVSGISGSVLTTNRLRPGGWQEISSPPSVAYGGIRFALSAGASAVHGMVKGSGSPVSGVPVYLEAYDSSARKRVAGLRTALSDLHGQYRFDGLAPGTYRILGTFEYLSPSPETMDAADAPALTLDAHSDVTRDLDLYAIR